MVREDILSGLRLALSQGESLKNAMMSFYNAGYKKQDIEDAARALQIEVASYPPANPAVQQKKQEPIQQEKLEYRPQEKKQVQEEKVIQKYSNYDLKPAKPKGDKIITILIILLIVLVAILSVVFIYREKVIDFLNNLL